MTIVYPSAPDAPPAALYHVNLHGLPMMSLSFVAEDKVVAGGHDSRPLVFSGSENGWDQGVALDDSASSKAGASSGGGPRAGGGGAGRLNNEAFNLFKSADSRGVASSASPLVPGATASSSSSAGSPSGMLAGTRMTPGGTELLSVHQNTIVSVRLARDGQHVHTAGSDGKLVQWPLSAGVGGITSGLKRVGI